MSDVTRILNDIEQGDGQTLAGAGSLVYSELLAPIDATSEGGLLYNRHS